MPYTLVKFLLWALLLAAIGGIIGWLLRSLTCRAEIARLRAGVGDQHEVARLRSRVAELDAVTAERDRLRMEIADVRGSSAGTLGFTTTVDAGALATASTTDITDDAISKAGTTTPDASQPDPSEVGAGLATLVPAERGAGDGAPTGAIAATTASSAPDDVAAETEPESAAPVVDLAAAAAALGHAIELDDLTVVEGIGPKIAELCAGIGLTTWRALADVDVATLQSMLADAGTRFKMHKPDTWPEQAALLADGRWDDFTALTDRFRGGS